VLVMPGSRIGLVRRMFQLCRGRRTAGGAGPNLHVVLPTVTGTEAFVPRATATWTVPRTLVSDVARARCLRRRTAA